MDSRVDSDNFHSSQREVLVVKYMVGLVYGVVELFAFKGGGDGVGVSV